LLVVEAGRFGFFEAFGETRDVVVRHVIAGHAGVLLEEEGAVAFGAVLAEAVFEELVGGAEGDGLGGAEVVEVHDDTAARHRESLQLALRQVEHFLLPQVQEGSRGGVVNWLPQVNENQGRLRLFEGHCNHRIALGVLGHKDTLTVVACFFCGNDFRNQIVFIEDPHAIALWVRGSPVVIVGIGHVLGVLDCVEHWPEWLVALETVRGRNSVDGLLDCAVLLKLIKGSSSKVIVCEFCGIDVVIDAGDIAALRISVIGEVPLHFD